jgi:hypothetical protein
MKKYNSITTQAILLLLSTTILSTTNASPSPLTSIQDISKSIINQTRRTLNLSNLFGSQTSIPSYDRLSSQPVFTVTTPWGSPYLLFERSDRTESNLEFDEEQETTDETTGKVSRQEKTNQVALYFMDEEDAMRLRDEMLQMEQMSGVDMRITASSLSKAVAQSANLHKGLLTGQPINDKTGKMKGPEEGGVLRYKIVPPKRELFYAARCEGRERVGLWGATPEEDAKLMLSSVPVIGGTLAMIRKGAIEKRRREKRRAATAKGGEKDVDEIVNPIRDQYKHMEGFVGVPVFHCPEMKKYNKIKGILRNDKREQTPLYFSYEDLVASWQTMRKNAKNSAEIPEKPTVEVFNMMDIVTSIDRDQWNVKRFAQLRRDALLGKIPLLNKITGTEGSTCTDIKLTPSGLDNVVFIPNSKSTKFKEQISSVGNGKARLRPMRMWGRDTM